MSGYEAGFTLLSPFTDWEEKIVLRRFQLPDCFSLQQHEAVSPGQATAFVVAAQSLPSALGAAWSSQWTGNSPSPEAV